MSFHLYLDTRESDGTSNYNTYWYLNNPRFVLMRDFDVCLRSIEFPNTVNPTNEYNNVVVFTPDSIEALSVALEPGSYTGDVYAATIAAGMQQVLQQYDTPTYAAAVVTGSYDSLSKKITLVCSVPIKFVLASNSAYEQMGFDESSFNTTATDWTSTYPVNLSGTAYVDVVTNLTVPSYNMRNSGHLLCRIQVDESFGNVIFYKNESTDMVQCTSRHIDRVEIKLFDDHGNPFKLPDNAHMSLVLTLQNGLDDFNEK
jgi:hypothetical protein